jgi:cytoskeletal protein CcmA (bactofilin family)
MFDQMKKSKESARPAEQPATSINLIGAGTVIEGEVKSSGDIRIDGTVVGQVHSKSKIVIGNTGRVEGDLFCQNADISGTVQGKSNVQEMLFLKSNGNVKGDIHTGKLVVEVGASFTGNCNMGPMVKEIKQPEPRPQQHAAPAYKEKMA